MDKRPPESETELLLNRRWCELKQTAQYTEGLALYAYHYEHELLPEKLNEDPILYRFIIDSLYKMI